MKKHSTKKRLKKFFFPTKIFSFEYRENIKNPKATRANLKERAANGSLLSIIGFVVIKADDHNKININGKIFIIFGL